MRPGPARDPEARAVESPAMDARPLGRSELAVTRIVLGCGNFGGVGSSPAFFGQGTPKETAFALMDRAWELGITTFDTADAYGGGRSETWIGEWRAAKGRRGPRRLDDPDEDVQPDGRGPGLTASRTTGSAGRSTRASRRLGVDHVARLHGARVRPGGAAGGDARSRSTSCGAPARSASRAPRTSRGEQLAEALEIAELEGLGRYEVVQNTLLAARPGRPRDGLPRLPRARRRATSRSGRSRAAGCRASTGATRRRRRDRG